MSLQPVLFYVGSGDQIQGFLLACKASTLPSELSSQPPWKILWFKEPKCSTALNDSCFEWGAVFRSTPSHNKHNNLVEIQCRRWGCTLSQSKLWSDARVVTYGPCVTCFYKSTFHWNSATFALLLFCLLLCKPQLSAIATLDTVKPTGCKTLSGTSKRKSGTRDPVHCSIYHSRVLPGS